MADLFAKRCVTGARCHVSSNGDPVGPVLRFPRFLVSGDNWRKRPVRRDPVARTPVAVKDTTGRPWPEDDDADEDLPETEPPDDGDDAGEFVDAWMYEAFELAGLIIREQPGKGWAVLCPWDAAHSSGEPGNTSTTLFTNGIFNCKHGSCVSRRHDDVVRALPDEARRIVIEGVHERTIAWGGAPFAQYVLEHAAHLSIVDIKAYAAFRDALPIDAEARARWERLVRWARRSS